GGGGAGDTDSAAPLGGVVGGRITESQWAYLRGGEDSGGGGGAGLVLHLDVVMVLRPVINPRTAASHFPQTMPDIVSSQRENHRQTNEQCSRHGRARHPSSDQLSRIPTGARSWLKGKAMKLRALRWCQDVDADGCRVGAP